MKSLLLAFALPLLALAIWGVVGLPYERWAQTAAPQLIILVLLMPLACAAASAHVVSLLSPRRQFDRRMGGGFARRFAAGFFGGLIAVATIGLLLIFADQFAPDAVLVAGAGLIAGAVAVLPLSRVRPAACFHCNYDLSAQPSPGQPGFGRCPECGEDTIEHAPVPRTIPSSIGAQTEPCH